MLRNLLLCGLLAGLCGGLLATGFARVVGETQINQAIAFEDAQYKAQGLPPEKPIVSRSLQSSARAADCRGRLRPRARRPLRPRLRGRLRARRPRQPGAHRASCWPPAHSWSLYLVPFIKYPANPPSVGDPDTITKRTALYLIMILISLLAAIAAVRLREGAERALVGLDGDAGRRLRLPARRRRRGRTAAADQRGAEDVPGGHAVPLPRGVARHAGS